MKLHEGAVGALYIVERIQIAERLARRLEALGINENTRIALLNKKKSGTLIIKVRGTRLALGQKIGDGIEIRPAAPEDERLRALSAGKGEIHG